MSLNVVEKKLLSTVATRDNFSEAAYLKSNPGVAEAVKSGAFRSGHYHFDLFGEKENREMLFEASISLTSESESKKKFERFAR